jgi:molybdopterin/thiamine biosynthesis adenylyltransferase
VCASFLVRAGVGKLRIVDGDVVEISDLHRQILFDDGDVADLRPKARAAAERLEQANPEVWIEPVVTDFSPENAEELAGDVDLIVDCSDNFETRLLLNEVCTKLSKPWIHGACISELGIVVPFPSSGSACYRCIVDHVPIPESVPSCREVGILGPVAGIVGSIEAAEAVKLIVNPSRSRQVIMFIDMLSYRFKALSPKRRLDCPVCSHGVYDYLNRKSDFITHRECGNDTVRLRLGSKIDLAGMLTRLQDECEVEDLDGILRLRCEGKTALIFGDGRAIVRGVRRVSAARKFISRLMDA